MVKSILTLRQTLTLTLTLTLARALGLVLLFVGLAPLAAIPQEKADPSGKSAGEKKSAADKKEKSEKKKKKKEAQAAKRKGLKASAAPKVVFNEILYHPIPNDPKREFLELLNPNEAPVDLSGWSIDGEASFTFPAGTRLAPHGLLVVGGKGSVIDAAYGIHGTLGPLKGKLSRKGGTIELLDARGGLVEEVTYDDKPPFPTEAAGGGASLERIHPGFKAGWHWKPGAVRYEWTRVEKTGFLSGDRLIIYLSGEGSCLIDDVRLVPRDAEGPNAVANSGFELGTEEWTFSGNHTGARVEGQGKEGKACLRLTASGPGFGSIHSARAKLSGIALTKAVTLSFWVRGERGTPRVVARLAGEDLVVETAPAVLGGSPGAPNRVVERDLAPWIRSTWHEPERPLPGQPTFVHAVVEDDDAVSGVTLEYAEVGEPEAQEAEKTHAIPMADCAFLQSDRHHGDRRVFTAMLPPFEEGSVVRYRVLARDGGGRAAPLEAQRAFYVGKPAPRGKTVGAFQLLLAPASAEALDRQKTSWVPAMAIFDGSVYDGVRARHRGHSSLGFPKAHWKLKFDGERLEGKKKVNLSASYADKSFLRELLSHAVFAEAGVPCSEVKRYSRLYLNGKYWGLYYQLEQPGKAFLKRTGRDPGGDLFKCYTAGRPSPTGDYSPSDFQNKSSKAPHFEQLHEFLKSMDSLSDAPLAAYLKKSVDAEEFAAYLAATAVVMNSDHVGKNYYLYRDGKSGKWSLFPWDLDLTFGRNFECGDPSPLLNDRIRWDNHLLFGTEAHPKCDIPGNRIIEKFLSLKEDRILLYRKVQKLLKTFTVARINGIVRPYYQALKTEVPLDRERWPAYGPRSTWDFEFQVKEIQRFVENRAKFLDQALGEAAANP